MRYLTIQPDTVLTLPAYGRLRETAHVFQEKAIEAINAALAARRPLLVRGEPGTGKSQLARAAAAALNRAFLPFAVDSRTEARDLLYTVDTVARLAEAQILGHVSDAATGDSGNGRLAYVRDLLAESRFTTPGPLWWVFDWKTAEEKALEVAAPVPWRPEATEGAVLLIDEIDKADPAVPNGLLEALGWGQFPVPGGGTIAAPHDDPPPLVLITTNEERALPDAFVRRCLVLQLGWPKNPEELVKNFIVRGRAHFPKLSPEVVRQAAEMVAEDREKVGARGVCPPGGAEYLDLLRAVREQWPDDEARQLDALKRVRQFTLRKHPEESAW